MTKEERWVRFFCAAAACEGVMADIAGNFADAAEAEYQRRFPEMTAINVAGFLATDSVAGQLIHPPCPLESRPATEAERAVDAVMGPRYCRCGKPKEAHDGQPCYMFAGEHTICARCNKLPCDCTQEIPVLKLCGTCNREECICGVKA